MAITWLPRGEIAEGSTLSLRYDPARGTMHARVDGGDEVLCFDQLDHDLVPAVSLREHGDACAVIVSQVYIYIYIYIFAISCFG